MGANVGPFGPAKPHVWVGVIGQLSHGKTTLTKATTRLCQRPAYRHVQYPQPEQWPSQDDAPTVAYSEYETAARYCTLVDCREHADYVKGVLIGSVQMDGAILVVAVTDGLTTEAREQVRLAHEVGVQAIVVFLNNMDSVDDPALADLAEAEVRELLLQHGYPVDQTPVVRGSALQALESSGRRDGPDAAAVWQLIDAVDSCIPTPRPVVDEPFMMAVRDVCAVKDGCTAAVGWIDRGMVRVGDSVSLIGLGADSRILYVAGVQRFGKSVDEARAHDSVEIMLHEIGRTDVRSGQVLAKPASIAPHVVFDARVYIKTGEEGGRNSPIIDGSQAQFSLHWTEVTGTIRLPTGVEWVMPGDSVRMIVELIMPVALEVGMRFAIGGQRRGRDGTSRHLGSGIIIAIVE